jgi:uncharacterized protein (DUF885 family)
VRRSGGWATGSTPGFHDRLLADGSLPMTVLDRVMTAWVDEFEAAPTGS